VRSTRSKHSGKLVPNVRQSGKNSLVKVKIRCVYGKGVCSCAKWRQSTRRVAMVALLHVVLNLINTYVLATRDEFFMPPDSTNERISCHIKLDRSTGAYDCANVPPIHHHATEARRRGLAETTLKVQKRRAHRVIRGHYRSALPDKLASKILVLQILWRNCHRLFCGTWNNAVCTWLQGASAHHTKSSCAVQRASVKICQLQLMRYAPAQRTLSTCRRTIDCNDHHHLTLKRFQASTAALF